MRVDVERIEKQIGEMLTRQMLFDRETFGKDDPAGLNAALFRLFAQIRFRPRVRLVQPQHTPLDRLQQAHPDVKLLRSDFIRVVETGEDERIFRAGPSGRA
jgi:hypothetical protein